jgi:mRNA interferase RelE/StbE
MRYDIVVAPQAVEDLKQLSARHRATVRDAMERHLRHQPQKTSKSRVRRLRGITRPQYRLRVGEIRVFYDVVEQSVQVLAIIPKSKASGWLAEAEKQR